MAEVVVGLQTADAIQGLVGGVLKLVEKILQARRDVQSLPRNIEELLKEVEGLKPVIDSIKAESLDKKGFLKPCLEKLEEELRRASVQLNDFKEKQKQDKSAKAWKIAKATVKQGDGKRQEEINSTRGTIKGLREELDKALNASTHLTGESTNTIVKETHLKVEALYQKTIVVSPPPITPPAIVVKLDRWARECTEDESYKIYFMLWDSQREEYCLPEQGNRRETRKDDKDEEGEIKRGAREGGWEVKNSIKVQFHIEVPRDCFFYVLSFEKPLTIPTSLELFFPKYSSDRNKILFSSKRRFPDSDKYKNDPKSCKVEQSHESLMATIEGQVLFYLVFSAEPLVQDRVKEVNINDIIEHLSLKDPGEDGDLPFYVERFLFDVK